MVTGRVIVIPVPGAELHYFCLRGLGEIPRLILELVGAPYDSVMYFAGPPKKEYKDYAPFGQMPIYTDKSLSGRFVAEQGAIVRHIGRATGLAGRHSCYYLVHADRVCPRDFLGRLSRWIG